MTTADLLTAFFGLGQGVERALAGGATPTTPEDWKALLANPDLQKHVTALTSLATQSDFDEAIAVVQAKHDALRAAKPLDAMTSTELATCLALSDTAQLLRTQNLYGALMRNPLQWAGEHLVPIAEQLAPLVIPIVLAAI